MWRALPGIIFFLLAALLLYSTYKKSINPTSEELIGQPAPELHLKKMEGFRSVPSAAVLFKHQYVLVNFFASWCAPCLIEHPFLNQLAQEYDLTIVGIAWRDSPANITAMLEEHGNPYDYVGLDQMDATAFSYSVEGLPESFLIGPDGTMISAHQGPLNPAIIQAKILPHIENNAGDNARE